MTKASAQDTSSQIAIWRFFGKKTTSENYLEIPSDALKGKDTLRLTFDIFGTCFHPNESTEIIFDQPKGQTWRFVQLLNYAQNCYRGKQTVEIPLADFAGLDLTKPVGTFHARFWHEKNYRVDVYNALVFNSNDSSVDPLELYARKINSKPVKKPRPSISPPPRPSKPPTPSPSPRSSLLIPVPSSSPRPSVFSSPSINPSIIPSSSPIPTSNPSPSPSPIGTPSPLPSSTPPSVNNPQNTNWDIQSVSSMKVTKDMICNQPDQVFIKNWVAKAKLLGANYISVETPYENPYCANALEFTNAWITQIREQGLKVWHRHMPLAFEGIYNTPKKSGVDNLSIISNYILNNPTMFAPGDIFTPIPEPQNGGIAGVTYCAQNVCQFDSRESFNKWLRDAIDVSEAALNSIGQGGKIDVGYFGFDGFVAWGHNNPDWEGILEDSTIAKMGEITIDHYPEAVGTDMHTDLEELHQIYPNAKIIIGEWGTINGGNTESQVKTTMQGAIKPYVVGFNYWHLGMGGEESLIEDNFSQKAQFDEVQSFFKP